MSYSYYVYYRVDVAQEAAAAKCVKQLFTVVKSGTGISGKLLKKRGEPNLWMEVYENVADSAHFEGVIGAAVAEVQAAGFLQPGAGRHVECFEN